MPAKNSNAPPKKGLCQPPHLSSLQKYTIEGNVLEETLNNLIAWAKPHNVVQVIGVYSRRYKLAAQYYKNCARGELEYKIVSKEGDFDRAVRQYDEWLKSEGKKYLIVSAVVFLSYHYKIVVFCYDKSIMEKRAGFI